jgi:ribosomal protein S18 acetylase RimI-like enzyme
LHSKKDKSIEILKSEEKLYVYKVKLVKIIMISNITKYPTTFSMNIRKQTTSDIERLERIFLITRQTTFEDRKDKFKIGDFMESTVGDDVWVCEIDGFIVGFISLYLQDNFIHNLFVEPQYQGYGVGSKLLLFAEDKLLRPMTLKVAMDNLKVCTFYEKYGWYNAGEFNKAPVPYILYRKDD